MANDPELTSAGVSLDDKYTLDQGRAFMSGVHALVRLPMLQRDRDLAQGHNTAGFISGYRGSPLGNYDQLLHNARTHLKGHHIHFQPGVNEELAATAIWGTQQMGFAPEGSSRYDGVFGIWYGKGPGVDRCSDVFKHANMAGTTPLGGVLAVAGDDHVAKSSTAAHQSDHIFKACGLPVFFPATVQDILDLGLHAIALSRYAGVWTGMKTIQEIVESSASVELDAQRVQIALPTDFIMPPGGVHIRWPDAPLEQEARLFHTKWYAALAYIRANRLNHNVIESSQDRFGIIASGKAYNDTRQALHDLGLDERQCRQLGIRLHKVMVVWPLEAHTTRAFATGLQEILVVEEKRQIIEYQIKEELYDWPDERRPRVLGKFLPPDGVDSGGEWASADPTNHTLLRANADLTPGLIARVLAQRLLKLGVDGDTAQRLQHHLDKLASQERSALLVPSVAERQPWFCSGCPHNTSTKVPDGSRAMAGIGCHFMAIWMNRSTVGFTQMGGEGVPWVGQQPFSNERHVFANLGDGTYFHSGLLAIRQSIAAGVNITYKILYNDAVAMTGGQPVGERQGTEHGISASGHSVMQIAASVRAEGAVRVTIVTDEPEKYQTRGAELPTGVLVEHRDALDRIQREFRETPGCTVIIYDQTCATEKRRRRKRGKLAEPAQHVIIHDGVCEGCGDCSEQSNCLSIEPLETALGRKRRINASTCNKDYACLKGFCPSFITVEGVRRRAKTRDSKSTTPAERVALPSPSLPPLAATQIYGIVVAGVGGTGVITIGQLLGMAAHLEGKGVITQDAAGLAQKGGATWSHVQLAISQSTLCTTRVPQGAADVVIGCDGVVTAARETLARVAPGRSRVALNSHVAPTAGFVRNADWVNPASRCIQQIMQAVGQDQVGSIDAEALASELMGDSLYTNPLLLGYAWQRGWIPLQLQSLQRAIELNAVAVERNLTAFAWGRAAAHDPAGVAKLLRAEASNEANTRTPQTELQALLADCIASLCVYQDAAYARRYQELMTVVCDADTALGRTENPQLSLTVARTAHKLMAYKDEYEVARLHADPTFHASLRAQFEDGYRLRYHMAPPLFSARDAAGHLQKRTYGHWAGTAMRWLAKLRFLRGTPLDPFGRTEERRIERAWIDRYERGMRELAKALVDTPESARDSRYEAALQLAGLPLSLRGFGHVKARNVERVQHAWDAGWLAWRTGAGNQDR